MRSSLLSVASFACGLAPGIFFSAAAQDSAVAVIGDQVRSPGYACSNAISAERIEAESRPEEPVYLLKCEGATYKVRIVPDQAAEVTKVE